MKKALQILTHWSLIILQIPRVAIKTNNYKHTKVLFLICYLFVFTMYSNAQSWNPYVNDGAANPNPLLPSEFNGEGVLSFHIGNSGNKPLTVVTNQEMTLIITLSYGVPDNTNPLATLGGTWADKFNWFYNEAYNTFTAIQNQEIQPHSEGTITVNYKATTNSRSTNPANGLNVNIQPPPYSNGDNFTDDDGVSIYTYVRAKDFGDAPASYGSASHEIDIYKNPVTGEYLNYIYLGHLVDAEAKDQPTAEAIGDDNSLSDDEDGITFPELIQGDTVDIPVSVTVHNFGTGLLNAWFDWNGDGDFLDEKEKIASPASVYESGKINLSVIVPLNAITEKETFARFRLGDRNVISHTLESRWGEVEDYQIQILPAQRMTITKQLISTSVSDQSGKLILDDILTYSVKAINTGNTILNNVIVEDNKISPTSKNCATLTPGDSCVLIGIYKVTQQDLDNCNIVSKYTVISDETKPVSTIKSFLEK